METRKPDAWGMLWFLNSRQYAEYLALFEDAHVMPSTFGQWQKRATQMYEELLRKGAVVMKIHASPDEFRTWCGLKGHRLNADGRMAFGSFKAYEKLRDAHSSHED
jgi:hypothetical protein